MTIRESIQADIEVLDQVFERQRQLLTKVPKEYFADFNTMVVKVNAALWALQSLNRMLEYSNKFEKPENIIPGEATLLFAGEVFVKSPRGMPEGMFNNLDEFRERLKKGMLRSVANGAYVLSPAAWAKLEKLIIEERDKNSAAA